jgi:hypothetical protein
VYYKWMWRMRNEEEVESPKQSNPCTTDWCYTSATPFCLIACRHILIQIHTQVLKYIHTHHNTAARVFERHSVCLKDLRMNVSPPFHVKAWVRCCCWPLLL